MEPNAILGPVILLGLLTLIVFFWMYILRIPAMNRINMDPQKAQHTSDLASLPNPARQVGDNYNHLFEQPVLFYAIVFVIWASGHVDALHVYLAWGVALLRVAHTLIQCTYNQVMHRFGVFALSWLLLGAMIVREAIALLAGMGGGT